LLPAGSRLANAIVNARRNAGGRSQPPALAFELFASLVAAEPPVWPTAPWPIGRLTTWWLQAGAVLARTDPAWRVELEAVITDPENGQPAALWCADRWDAYALSQEAFERQCGKDPSLTQSGAALIHYITRLVRFALSHERGRRDRSGQECKGQALVDRLKEEGQTMVADVRRLFGPKANVQASKPLEEGNSGEWAATWARPDGSGQAWMQIRRPLVRVSTGRSEVLAKGLAKCAKPGAVLAASPVGAGQGKGPPADSLGAAIAFARDHWPGDYQPSIGWPRATRGCETQIVAPVDGAVLGVARLLAAIERRGGSTAGPENVTRLADSLRIALFLDGFQVMPEPAEQGELERLLPWIGPSVPSEPQRLVLFHRSSGSRLPIGWTGLPGGCPEAIASAVEAVDWLLWAFKMRATVEATARLARVTCEAALADAWEGLKRRLLAAPLLTEDGALLAEAFVFAHERRLALELLQRKLTGGSVDGPEQRMLHSLADGFAGLATEILRHLQAVNPVVFGTLRPPRHADGAVDWFRWGIEAEQRTRGSGDYELVWVRSERPCGEQVREYRAEDRRILVELSAGRTADADLLLLQAAFSSGQRRGTEWGALAGTFRARAAEKLAARPPLVVLDDDVDWLRQRCAGPDADAFDDLVRRRLQGDADAVAWCDLLKAEPRFAFDVHPPVDWASGRNAVVAADHEGVRWEFHDVIPDGADIAVRYAVVPAAARRVVSRGPRLADSAAARAEALEAAATGSDLAELAAAVRLATDRWLAFPGQVVHPAPQGLQLLARLLNEDAAAASVRTAVFTAMRDWFVAVGHEVVPREWSPGIALDTTRFNAVLGPPVFSETVAAGSVVLRAFGLVGDEATPCDAAVSAGPPPAAYADVCATVSVLAQSPEAGHTPTWQEAVARVQDLPRHSLANTLSLAGPNLFDCVWDSASTMPATAPDSRVDDLKKRILDLLKAACGLLPFEPTSVHDMPSGWIQEADGRPPRGRRIRMVQRPGLRTIDNRLVRPAIVTTE
jgi:hypothetical protein